MMRSSALVCLMAVVVCLSLLLGSASASSSPLTDSHHALQKRQTVSETVERLFSGSSPISLTTVGVVILILLALDVLFTLGFAAVVANGRSRQDYDIPFLGAAANHLYNSFDMVDSALSLMSVEEEMCRHKAVCIAERAAVRNPFAKLAINTINNNLKGLNTKYREAVEAGLSGADCELIYDECTTNVAFF